MTAPGRFDDTFSAAQEALSNGAFARAAQLLGQCTRQQPEHPSAWFLLGASLDRCGNLLGAAQAFSRTETLDPTHPQAANALAAMLSMLGRKQDALAAFRRALLLNPGDAQILTNIGIISEQLGRQEEALACYDAALASSPDDLGALNNRGALLLKLQRPQQALDDHLRFAALAPANTAGHYNCAEAYSALSREDDAIACCNAVLQREPGHMKALFLRGALLASTGRFPEAIADLDQARHTDQRGFAAMLETATLDPGQPSASNVRNIYCLRGLDRLLACDWRDRARLTQNIEQMAHPATQPDHTISHAGIPLNALALPLRQETQLALARLVAADIGRHYPAAAALPPAPTDSAGRIRIGYVSPDFQEHAVGHLLRGFFRQHDRHAFAVHAYSLQTGKDSPVRRDIIAGCEVFRDVAGMTAAAIADLIRRDGIDILVDLAGYTTHAHPEIFAARPAPLNIAYLGYPGTSGSDWMDYFVTNPVASPAGQEQFFSEKMIYLPHGCFPYPHEQEIAPPRDRQFHGLPQDAFIFCCFNHSYKIEPLVFAAWMRLMHRLPESILWLHAPHAAVADNLSAEAAAQGIDPARLVFAPHVPLPEHLARYQIADLFLDTFLYGAGTTGMDALWAGLPLLSCPGRTYTSRFGASHLAALDLPELVAGSQADYEERAFHLATHPAELQAIRQKLAAQRSHAPLFRTEQLARHLETGYRQAWDRHRAGLPPAHIRIAEQ